MFFASAIVGTGNKEQVIFLLGGNIATSVAFGPMYILMNKMGLGREMHEFDYWARLPLPKAIFVSAFISGSLLLALPGLLGVYIIGSQLLGFSPLNVLIFLPIIILGAVPLAAIGATLGSYIPSGQVANVIANTVLLFIGFLSPMFFPLQLLPEPLRVIAWLLPTTYLADALRSLLGSYQGTHFLVDILFLSICTIVSLFLVQWKLDWRIEA